LQRSPSADFFSVWTLNEFRYFIFASVGVLVQKGATIYMTLVSHKGEFHSTRKPLDTIAWRQRYRSIFAVKAMTQHAYLHKQSVGRCADFEKCVT
jgi:hypothetical protein